MAAAHQPAARQGIRLHRRPHPREACGRNGPRQSRLRRRPSARPSHRLRPQDREAAAACRRGHQAHHQLASRTSDPLDYRLRVDRRGPFVHVAGVPREPRADARAAREEGVEVMRELPKVISVDDHIVEPAHLWQERLPAKMREQGPRIERARWGDMSLSTGASYNQEMTDDGQWGDYWLYEDRLIYEIGRASCRERVRAS